MNPTTEFYLEQLKKDAESVGGTVFHIRNNTPSMLGAGYAGNAVVVLPQMKYEPGQDVVFKAGEKKNSIHRVTAIKPGFVYTKGIFNERGDGWIPISDVFGKVVQVVKTRGDK